MEAGAKVAFKRVNNHYTTKTKGEKEIMEKMVVFGKQEMSFDTKDGKHVEGIKLHCTKEPPNAHWTGYGYEGIFVDIKSDLYKVAASLPVQSTINCEFNRYGKVNSFEVCK